MNDATLTSEARLVRTIVTDMIDAAGAAGDLHCEPCECGGKREVAGVAEPSGNATYFSIHHGTDGSTLYTIRYPDNAVTMVSNDGALIRGYGVENT